MVGWLVWVWLVEMEGKNFENVLVDRCRAEATDFKVVNQVFEWALGRVQHLCAV